MKKSKEKAAPLKSRLRRYFPVSGVALPFLIIAVTIAVIAVLFNPAFFAVAVPFLVIAYTVDNMDLNP